MAINRTIANHSEQPIARQLLKSWLKDYSGQMIKSGFEVGRSFNFSQKEVFISLAVNHTLDGLKTLCLQITCLAPVMYNNGVPIESVAKMMWHTSIKTTQIYTKVMPLCR